MFSPPKFAKRICWIAGAGFLLLSGCANARRCADCEGYSIPGCHGYHSTCWRPWPEECVTCPSPFMSEDAPGAIMQSGVPRRESGSVAEVRVEPQLAEAPTRMLPSAPSSISRNRRALNIQPKPVSYLPEVPVPARAPLPGDLPLFYGGK